MSEQSGVLLQICRGCGCEMGAQHVGHCSMVQPFNRPWTPSGESVYKLTRFVLEHSS